MPTRDRPPIVSTALSAAALLTAAAAAGAVLREVQPHLAGSPSSWRGNELALAAAWFVAVACTVWLALTTLACLVAVVHGDRAIAARIAAFAPPVARRLLQTALIGAVMLSPRAAGAALPPAPITVRVGASGHLTAPPASSAHPGEVPVVRAPPPTTTTTAPPRTTTTTTTRSTTTFSSGPSTTVPRAVAPTTGAPKHPRAAPIARTYVVRAGDNLWSISAREVARRDGRPATDAETANYWLRLVAANRSTLRSGDPSLIFPDELVTLPLD